MAGDIRFIDTSVLLRHLLRDDEEKAERTLALLLRVERGEVRLATSPLVIFETVFTLQRRYGVDRQRIRNLVEPIIQLRELQIPDKRVFYRAFDLYVHHRVAFADAYNVATMETRGITDIYAWDVHYDRFDGIKMLEPEHLHTQGL